LGEAWKKSNQSILPNQSGAISSRAAVNPTKVATIIQTAEVKQNPLAVK